jgi:hypothetical protein
MGTGLVVQAPPQRVEALLRMQHTLLARIKRKRTEHARLEQQLKALPPDRLAEGAALTREAMALDKQTHVLFGHLLARGGDPPKVRRTVREVYDMLVSIGALYPAIFHHLDVDDDDPHDPPHAQEASHARKPADAGMPSDEDTVPPWAGGGVSADRGQNRPGATTLRALYLRIVNLLHPDKVQDEAQKRDRTQRMQALTQAYQAGDLARLLALEQDWLLASQEDAAAPVDQTDGEAEARCRQLEAMNQALRGQMNQLLCDLRVLRRSPLAQFWADRKHAARGQTVDPIEYWLCALRSVRDDLFELQRFVTAFGNGEISLHEFAAGPRSQPERPISRDASIHR